MSIEFWPYKKSNFNIKELYYSTIRACVQEYYDSFNKIRIPVTYKKDCKILLTGGVINKSKLMIFFKFI